MIAPRHPCGFLETDSNLATNGYRFVNQQARCRAVSVFLSGYGTMLSVIGTKILASSTKVWAPALCFGLS
jgi:hypothetical protein